LEGRNKTKRRGRKRVQEELPPGEKSGRGARTGKREREEWRGGGWEGDQKEGGAAHVFHFHTERHYLLYFLLLSLFFLFSFDHKMEKGLTTRTHLSHFSTKCLLQQGHRLIARHVHGERHARGAGVQVLHCCSRKGAFGCSFSNVFAMNWTEKKKSREEKK
jgi:hypothetical protein